MKTKPHFCNVEAERGALACIFLDNSNLSKGREIVRAEDFLLPGHRLIYEAILAVSDRGMVVDYLTVMDELNSEEKLEAAGGIEYLSALPEGFPRLSVSERYFEIVREKAVARSLRAKMSALLENESLPASQIIDGMSEELNRAQGLLADAVSDEKSRRDASVNLLQSLDEKPIRVFSGVASIDEMTGGFLPGELAVLTAETGVGKTIFAQQISRHSCEHDLVSLYCSGEMTAEQLVSRELAAAAQVKPGKMRHPHTITPDETDRLVDVAARACTRCKILDVNLTTQKIARTARRMKAKDRLDLVVIDYDELVEAEGKDDLEVQQNVVRFSKALAMEHRLVVILVSQLRKSLDERDRKRPSIQRIYGSGAKSKHPSVILYVDRPFQRELQGRETDASIAVLKNRNGRMGMVKCKFNLDTLRFEDE